MQALVRGSTAVSPEAQAVSERAGALEETAELSQVLFGEKAGIISELRALVHECSKEGWDGYQATAIDPLAVLMAEGFIRALPDQFALPEIAPEPDGAVSMDWIDSPHRVFSVSVSASNRLAYAWVDGTDKGHGVARFYAGKIPSRMIESIREIMNHEHATIRAA